MPKPKPTRTRIPGTASTSTVTRQAAKRIATEQRILAAFERVLRRDGMESIGVNAIVQEAGVGKGLIYEYFGGLEGLVEAWASNRQIAPPPEAIIGEPLSRFLRRPAAQRIAQVHTHYAAMLRASPLALHAMAEELQKPGKLRKALAMLRARIGTSHEKIFTEIAPLRDDDQLAVCMVFLAAANYLALRSRSSPNFNGIRLDRQEGWNTAMDFFDRVAALIDRPSR